MCPLSTVPAYYLTISSRNRNSWVNSRCNWTLKVYFPLILVEPIAIAWMICNFFCYLRIGMAIAKMDPSELFLFVNALNFRRDVHEIAIAIVKLIASVNRPYDSDGEGGVWNGIGPAGFTHVIWNHQECSPGIPVMWLMMRAASKLGYPWQHWKLCKLGRVIYFNVPRFDVAADSVSELSVPFSGHVFSSRGEFRNVFRNVVRTFFAKGKRRDRYCWLPPATVVTAR